MLVSPSWYKSKININDFYLVYRNIKFRSDIYAWLKKKERKKKTCPCKIIRFHTCHGIGLRRFKIDEQVHIRTIVITSFTDILFKFIALPEAE